MKLDLWMVVLHITEVVLTPQTFLKIISIYWRMARCEMCGRDDYLLKAEVEGTEMEVCSGCAQFGVVRKGISGSRGSFQSNSQRKPLLQQEPEVQIISGFASLLRQARESRKMNQEDFAKFLQEKGSLVAKWEQGSVQPNIDTAKRLERILGRRLVIQGDASEEADAPKRKGDELTLGDFIKVRKRH